MLLIDAGRGEPDSSTMSSIGCFAGDLGCPIVKRHSDTCNRRFEKWSPNVQKRVR